MIWTYLNFKRIWHWKLISPFKQESHSPNLDPELNSAKGHIFCLNFWIALSMPLTDIYISSNYFTASDLHIWTETCWTMQEQGHLSILLARGLTKYVKNTPLRNIFPSGVLHQVKHSTFPLCPYSFECINFFLTLPGGLICVLHPL